MFASLLHRSPIHKPCFDYLWGRKDCHTAPTTDAIRDFGAGWLTKQQLFAYFQRTFHFTKEQVRGLIEKAILLLVM